LITGGLFVKSAVTITYGGKRVSQRDTSAIQRDANRNSHELLDLLNLMSSWCCLQTLKSRCDPRFADVTLHRLNVSLLRLRVVTPKDNFVIVIVVPVVFVEECLFIVEGARSNFHLQGMLFCVLLHFLQMLIVTIFCEPCDDVTIRPVNLESVRVLIINMVLRTFETVSDARLRKDKEKTIRR
jgi:hypothetical protein